MPLSRPKFQPEPSSSFEDVPQTYTLTQTTNLCCNFDSDVGIYDRVVIQELLKTVAQCHQLDSSSQRDFKG